MSPRDGETPTQDRQDSLEDLLQSAEQIPGATEAIRAYEELQRSMASRIVTAEGEVTYSTGGNS